MGAVAMPNEFGAARYDTYRKIPPDYGSGVGLDGTANAPRAWSLRHSWMPLCSRVCQHISLADKTAAAVRLIGYARVSTEDQGTDPQCDELRTERWLLAKRLTRNECGMVSHFNAGARGCLLRPRRQKFVA
jgi:hypothetical protein